MKKYLIKAGSTLIRIFLQYSPMSWGKRAVWDHVARPYLIWRDVATVAKSKFGYRLEGEFSNFVFMRFFFFGIWEPGISRVISWHLKPGDIVIDVGANIGAHTLLMAKIVGSTGRVFAIEASPYIFTRLLRNIELNNIYQITPINVAATDKNKTVSVFLPSDSNLGLATIVASEADRLGAIFETEIFGMPLPEIVTIEQLTRARLIKIDVEGAEWLVLSGMMSHLTALHEECLILLELNRCALSSFGVTPESVISLFREVGWEAVEVANSYSIDFYIDPPLKILQPNVSESEGVSDLVFSRPMMRQKLLSSML